MAQLLMLGPGEKDSLQDLAERALGQPVDMPVLVEAIKTPEGAALHRERMQALTTVIPVGIFVTFSVEDGHPAGRCRHMSVSIHGRHQLPNTGILQALADELGFWGTLRDCTLWMEHLSDGGDAINVVQPWLPPARGSA